MSGSKKHRAVVTSAEGRKGLPVVAIVGRPNVGKSTFFNRMTGQRRALTFNRAGVTRDRHYGEVEYLGRPFILIDTGGFEPDAAVDDVFRQVKNQALLAVEEADVVVVFFDARQGVMPGDQEVVDLLRSYNKPTIHVVNKADSPQLEAEAYDFYRLGMEELYPISLEGTRGGDVVLDALLDLLPKMENPKKAAQLSDDEADALEELTRKALEASGDLLDEDLDEDAVSAPSLRARTLDDGDADFEDALDDEDDTEDDSDDLEGDEEFDEEDALDDEDDDSDEDDLSDEEDDSDALEEVPAAARSGAAHAASTRTTGVPSKLIELDAFGPGVRPNPKYRVEVGDDVWDEDAEPEEGDDEADYDDGSGLEPELQDEVRKLKPMRKFAPPVIPRIALVGRPNVGKSSLANRILGYDRQVIHPEAGTTRDSIDIPFERDGESFVLVDTAGVRRRARITDKLEAYTVIKAFRAIEAADIALLLLDAREGVTSQEKRLAGLIEDKGKGVAILVNKWDLITGIERQAFAEKVLKDLEHVRYAPVHFLSAKTGMGVNGILPLAKKVSMELGREISTTQLNRFLKKCVDAHHPALYKNNSIRLYYGVQVRNRPPTFLLFTNVAEGLRPDYRRYLENRIREEFGFVGAPVHLVVRARKQSR